MPGPLPPRLEQRKMVERIQSLISMADEVEESVRQADYYIERMNASVLAKAFTGKLVPQDPKDEPASIILERINTERKKKLGVTKFNEFYVMTVLGSMNFDNQKYGVRIECNDQVYCRRCNMEFTSGDQIIKLSQHIIDKHHGKMYLPYEMIKNHFIVED